jgi:hypothetical protein
LVAVATTLESIDQQAPERLPFGRDRWHGINKPLNRGGQIPLG